MVRKIILSSILALASAMGASATVSWNLAGATYTVDTLSHVTIGPGMTNTVLRIGGGSNVYINTIDLRNPNVELRQVIGNDGSSAEYLSNMASRKSAATGKQYIAAVNGDFFDFKTANPHTVNGTTMVDGQMFNICTDPWWETLSPNLVVNGSKDVKIYQGFAPAPHIKFPTHNYDKYRVRYNVNRADNYLCIYDSNRGATTNCNEWGVEVAMTLVSGSIAGNDAVFRVTSAPSQYGVDRGMTIPSGGYVLSGNGAAVPMMQSLEVGTLVSMSYEYTYDNLQINPTQIISGFPLLVENGQKSPEKYWSEAVMNTTSGTGTFARTAIGYDKDRSKLIMVVIEKAAAHGSVAASNGANLNQLAALMIRLGCYTAMNLDGGESSTIYSGALGVQNNTRSGAGIYRPLANALFAVETSPVDNNIAKIEVVQKNVKLNNGQSFTPTVYGYNQYGVLVNTNVTGFTFTVASRLGSVNGTTFTANATKGSTHGIVRYGNATCGVRILTNAGGAFVSSGADAPLQVEPGYAANPDPALGSEEKATITEMWSFVNYDYNDGWDGTAPNWNNPTAIKSKSCPRFATAYNGKLYTVDMKTMSIAEIDEQGNITPKYQLPSLEGETVNGKPDYYGCAIAHDDAGNFIVGHYFTQPESYRVITVYSPTLNAAKRFVLPLEGVSGSALMTAGRIDNFGKAVGDVTRDGYLYIAPQATGNLETQRVNMIHFIGQGKLDDTLHAYNKASTGIYQAGNGGDYGLNTSTICQPKYATAAETGSNGIFNGFYWYSKAPAGGIDASTTDLFTFTNDVTYSQNYSRYWNNYSKLTCFHTFVLNGKRYFVVAYCDENGFRNPDAYNASGQWIMIRDEFGNEIAQYKNENYRSNAGYMSMCAEVVGKQTVDIYVYNCTGTELNRSTATSNQGAIAGMKLRVSIGDEEERDLRCVVNYSDFDENNDLVWEGVIDDGNDNNGAKFVVDVAEDGVIDISDVSIHIGATPIQINAHTGYLFTKTRIFAMPGAVIELNGQNYTVPYYGFITEDLPNVAHITLNSVSAIKGMSFDLCLDPQFFENTVTDNIFPTMVGEPDGNVIPTNYIRVDADGNRTASRLVIVDGADFDLIDDVNVDQVMHNRTFSENLIGTWQALYLPYEITNWTSFASEVITCVEAVERNGQITLVYEAVPNTAHLAANTLYIFKPIAGHDFSEANTVVGANGTDTEQTFETEHHTVTIAGTYKKKTDMYDTGAYGLSGGMFKRAANANVALKAFRIYLVVTDKLEDTDPEGSESGAPQSDSIKIVVRGEGSGTTGITDIDAEEGEVVYYDLMGRRVANPATGVYIVNGEKQLMR